MKKIPVILLAIITVAAIFSCNGELKTDTNTLNHLLPRGLAPGYKWIELTSEAALTPLLRGCKKKYPTWGI